MGSLHFLSLPLWSPNGKYLAVNLKSDDYQSTPLVVWNMSTGKQIARVPPASRFAWSPDSTRLALFTDRVQVLDIRTGNVLWSEFSGHEPNFSAFYPYRIRFDINDPEGNCQSPQNDLAWSPDGSRLAVATTVSIYPDTVAVVFVGVLKTVYTRAGEELTDPQGGCKLRNTKFRSSGEQPCLGVRQC